MSKLSLVSRIVYMTTLGTLEVPSPNSLTLASLTSFSSSGGSSGMQTSAVLGCAHLRGRTKALEGTGPMGRVASFVEARRVAEFKPQ